MPKDKSTGKKLADMMYGNPEGAAFGITPMIGKRREDRQDREAAKSFPVDLARGVVAGAVGLPGDIESLARLPYELYTGNDSPTFLPTSEDVLKRIPFGTNTPAGQFASGLGTLAGGSANLGAIPRAVKAAPGALAAGARNLSAPRTLNPQAGVFIGPKAKTFHQGKADMAVAMEEAGRTPQEIWLATGTFRGADGILRQEISDRNALFNMPDALTEKVTAQKELINAKKELLRPDKSGQKDLFPKALTEAKRPVRQEIDELKGELREMDKSPRTQGVNAKYTLEHPELYAAYPELMDVPIVQNYKLGPLKGSLTSGGGKIYGMDVNDVKNPRSVALHEMQHAVQNIEGMSPGASPMMAFSTPEWKDLYKSYKDAYLARLPEGQTITMAMDDQLAQKAANRWYELQYGEAEARAVQARKDKTAQERAESFPYNSFDVNPKDMLTRKPFPNSGQTQSGSVHISDNPDVMQLELAAGGAVRMQAGGLAKAAKALKAAKDAPMKASEALGRIEGRPLVITQADRTKVGGGYLGGPGFSGLQLEDPAYRAAEAAWAVKNPGTAKMILGGRGESKDAVYAAMLGTPTQHQSNQMVFDKLLGDFKKAAKKGGLDPELRDRINMRLANSVDKDGNNIFPPDVDILDKNFKDLASTFDRRSVTANLIGGMGVGGKKGQIIDYDKIIRQTTDPMLLESPTGALGNRLFTLSGGIIERPDLHPAFPTIMQGEDLGVSFSPVARDLIMKDFTEKTMREKGRAPGIFDYTRGYPPSQLITEDILTEMQKLGLKKGGAVHKAAGGEITADDLILEERKL
jgi:hypothetical protein